MKLKINGENREVSSETVSGLLEEMQIQQDSVVIELNKNIVHKQKFDQTILKNSDSIEIVTIVGGG